MLQPEQRLCVWSNYVNLLFQIVICSVLNVHEKLVSRQPFLMTIPFTKLKYVNLFLCDKN